MTLLTTIEASLKSGGAFLTIPPELENIAASQGALTFPFTVTDATLLLVHAGVRGGQTVTGVTFNGVPLTFVRKSIAVIATQSNLWVLVDPPKVTGNIVITTNAPPTTFVGHATGVKNCRSFSSVDGAFGSLPPAYIFTPTNFNVPSKAQGLVLDFCSSWNAPAAVVGAEQTQLSSFNSVVHTGHRGFSSSKPAAAGSTNMFWTNPSGNTTMVAVGLEPLRVAITPPDDIVGLPEGSPTPESVTTATAPTFFDGVGPVVLADHAIGNANLLLVFVGFRCFSVPEIVKYAGVPLTRVTVPPLPSASGTQSDIWMLVDPPVGVADVEVFWPASSVSMSEAEVIAIGFLDAGSVGMSAKAAGANHGIIMTPLSAEGGLTVDIVTYYPNTTHYNGGLVGAGQTLLADVHAQPLGAPNDEGHMARVSAKPSVAGGVTETQMSRSLYLGNDSGVAVTIYPRVARVLSSTSKVGSGSASPVTDPIDTTAGDQVVIFTGAFAGGPYSVNDSAGNTWELISVATEGFYVANAWMPVGPFIKSPTHTFTFNTGGGSAESMRVVLLKDVGPVEYNVEETADANSIITGPTGVPATGGSIFLSAVIAELGSGKTLSLTSPDFTALPAIPQGPNNLALSVAYKSQPAAEAEDCTWTAPAGSYFLDSIILSLPYLPPVPTVEIIGSTSAFDEEGAVQTITTPAIDTTGASLLLVFGTVPGGAGSVTIVTDSAGNTWTPQASSSGGGSTDLVLFTSIAPVKTSPTHTFTFDAGGSGMVPSMVVMALSGSEATIELNQDYGSGELTTVFPFGPSGPSSAVGALWLAAMGSSGASAVSVSGGYTIVENVPLAGMATAVASHSPTGHTPPPESGSWTIDSNASLACLLVSIRPA